MSEQMITGYENGQPVFGELLTQEEKIERLAKTSEWVEFIERFDMSSEPNKNLLAMLFGEKLGDDSDVKDYQNLLKLIMASGGVVRVSSIGQCEFEIVPVIEEVVEAEVLRDRNGNPLSASQLAWKEYREFSETHSMQECRNRANADAGYGSFFRKQYERETAKVGDSVTNLNQRQQASTTPPAEELIAFAAEYYKTSAEKLRQLKRADINPFGFQEWNRKFEACVAAGLI